MHGRFASAPLHVLPYFAGDEGSGLGISMYAGHASCGQQRYTNLKLLYIYFELPAPNNDGN